MLDSHQSLILKAVSPERLKTCKNFQPDRGGVRFSEELQKKWRQAEIYSGDNLECSVTVGLTKQPLRP